MRQLRSWREFRRWQKYNRDDFNDWGDQRFVELELAHNRFDRAYRYEYPEYTAAVKKLLGQYGFTRSFQFHEDLIQQDRLTTWIEYLGFEYWQFEWSTRSIKRLQPKYHEAWEKLVDSLVLRPLETAESIRTDEAALRRESEREQAEKDLNSAKFAAGVVLASTERAKNDPCNSKHTRPERLRMLAEAKSRLDAAQELLNYIRRRNDLIIDFIQDTWKNEIAKEDAEHHSVLVQWILEQFPLLEAELESSKATEDDYSIRRGTKRKLPCQQDACLQGGRHSKKRRGNGQSSCLDDRPIATSQEKPWRRHHDNLINDECFSGSYKSSSQHPNRLHDESNGACETLVGQIERSRSRAAMGTTDHNKLASKHRTAGSHHLLRSNVHRSSMIPQQLRRSARIAARLDLFKSADG